MRITKMMELSEINHLPRMKRKAIMRSPYLMSIALVGILFVGYIIYQSNDYLFGPKLILEKPVNGATVKNAVTFSGVTEPDARLFINGFEIFSNENGIFRESLPLNPGYHTIVVKVANKFNKETIVYRDIIVEE